MGFFGRGWKHTSRFFSKPFISYNKDNLKNLEKLLVQIPRGKYPGDVYLTKPNAFKFGKYDFTWTLALDQTEYNSFMGEWISNLQSFVARQSTGRVMVLNSGTRSILFNATDSKFWGGLQDTKRRYRKIAKDKTVGFFAGLYAKVLKITEKTSDSVHRNKFFGFYMTQYDNVNTVYNDCQKTGAENETEKKILVGGGLYRILKDAGSITYKSLKIAGGDLSSISGVVTKGMSLLNKLGGLVAGLTDLVQGKESDFRTLSARFGLDKSLEELKKKLIGPEEQGTLLEQTIAGPQRLERSADLTFEELDALRKQMKHSIWWCDNWKLDIKELKKDIDKPEFIRELQQRLKFDTEDAIIKPSDILKLARLEKQDKAKIKEEIKKLEKKVASFDYFLKKRVDKLNDLLAAHDTRRSIAKTQKTLASTGVVFDAPRQLAHEIKGFDRSKLRKVKKKTTGSTTTIGTIRPKPKKKKTTTDEETSLHDLVKKALAERRTAIAYDDDDDDDDEDFDF